MQDIENAEDLPDGLLEFVEDALIEGRYEADADPDADEGTEEAPMVRSTGWDRKLISRPVPNYVFPANLPFTKIKPMPRDEEESTTEEVEPQLSEKEKALIAYQGQIRRDHLAGLTIADVSIEISPEDESVEASWQNYANCLGVDPDLFFPERGASTREAKEVCRGCVVTENCLEYALANGDKFGIWGGTSERERRRIRRARVIAAREIAASIGVEIVPLSPVVEQNAI
jgi:WhiB family redox-sensing transcriptional regulator